MSCATTMPGPRFQRRGMMDARSARGTGPAEERLLRAPTLASKMPHSAGFKEAWPALGTRRRMALRVWLAEHRTQRVSRRPGPRLGPEDSFARLAGQLPDAGGVGSRGWPLGLEEAGSGPRREAGVSASGVQSPAREGEGGGAGCRGWAAARKGMEGDGGASESGDGAREPVEAIGRCGLVAMSPARRTLDK